MWGQGNGINSLYEGNNFNYSVTKYGDNGGVKTKNEMNEYFNFYKLIIGHEWYYHQYLEKIATIYKRLFIKGKDSSEYSIVNKLYKKLRM